MHSVIVTPDLLGAVNNGGIGTFVHHLARLLQQHGDDVTLVYTGRTAVKRGLWASPYEQQGMHVIHVQEPPHLVASSGHYSFTRVSEQVARMLPSTADIVYFQDWCANGFHAVREKRFTSAKRPLYVTVMHSSTAWAQEGMATFPTDAQEQLGLLFAERYTVQNSDHVVSPSAYMVDWVRQRGWVLPNSTHVLGLPYLPTPHNVVKQAGIHQPIRKLVYFGRLETRKGFELFIDAVRSLHNAEPALLARLDEIVFLGKEGLHAYGTTDAAIQSLASVGVTITFHVDWGTEQAQSYLAQHAAEILVVMPSIVDNFPYSVIETSLIPNLRFVCSNRGGVPEILGAEWATHLFDPFIRPLHQKLSEWLTDPPLDYARPTYNWTAANERWLAVHTMFCEQAKGLRRTFVSVAAPPARVDVCVPYFNHGAYLPHTLRSLAMQTTDAFHVTVIDDGSTDAYSVAVFDELRREYPTWTFIRKENSGLSDTRNYAARTGSAAFIVFIDADNVATPDMVRRMLEAIQLSGSGCLTCYTTAFGGTGFPYRILGGKLIQTALTLYTYTPLGNYATAGLFTNCYGDANFIIRRSVFDAIGGFNTQATDARYVGLEDYELLARLSLSGYQLDVIPEYLYYYRHIEGSMYRTLNMNHSMLRVLNVYRDALQTVHLGDLAPIAYGLYQHSTHMSDSPATVTNPQWIADHIPWYRLRDAILIKIAKFLRRLR
jgi:O-antigen biosynthesis protein